jgi:hypothetical protein
MIVSIGKEALASFAAGNGSVGASAIQLPGAAVSKHVVIRASSDNGNVVIVGHSPDAVGAGFVLAAGEQTPPIYVDDLSKVWVKGGAASQAFSWLVN